MKIDILGKAPSLAEIEDYNAFLVKKLQNSQFLSWSFVVASIVFVALSCWSLIFTSFSSFTLFFIALMILGGHISLIIIARFFRDVGFVAHFKMQYFLSPNMCLHLAELIAKYPEVASYRDQVVAHGREFLESEYRACLWFEKKNICKEIYRVNGPTVAINTTA